MKNSIIILTWLVLIITSCDEDLVAPNVSSEIIGTWVVKEYKDSTTVMMKSDEFDEDKYGFSVLPSGLFIERKNIGGCGTPPVTYGNYEGRWKAISKKKINVEVEYWGGIMKYIMEIVSLSSDELEFKLADVEYN